MFSWIALQRYLEASRDRVWVAFGSVAALAVMVECHQQWRHGVSAAPARGLGLGNFSGSDCYMNATLQALASLDLFVNYLRAVVSREHVSPGLAFLRALRNLLDELDNPGPGRESACLSWAHMVSRQRLLAAGQQDAHEFLHVLMQMITTEAERATRRGLILVLGNRPSEKSSREASVQSPFSGLLAATRRCSQCQQETALHLQPFEVLTLGVPLARGVCTVETCLQNWAALDVVENVRCATCGILQELQLFSPTRQPGRTYQLLLHLPAGVRGRLLRTNPALAQVFRTGLEYRQWDTVCEGDILPVRSSSVRVIMMVRLPDVLCLHINRYTCMLERM